MTYSIRDKYPRFIKADPISGCWLWSGSVDGGGYGNVHRLGKIMRAHRLAYEYEHGSLPEGLFILHRCDNKLCVNPAHLWAGTHVENMHDMKIKGRAVALKGEDRTNTVLTENQVREIRQKYSTGLYLQKRLAREYGVDQSQISHIVTGKHWRHVA